MPFSAAQYYQNLDTMDIPATKIAWSLQHSLYDSIRFIIPSNEDALAYLHTHYRLCLSNSDKSTESHWYRVYSKEQILEVNSYFCPEVSPSVKEAAIIVDAIIAGYSIDLSRPVYMSYDLNRRIPIDG